MMFEPFYLSCAICVRYMEFRVGLKELTIDSDLQIVVRIFYSILMMK